MNNPKHNPLSPIHDPAGVKVKCIKEAKMKNDVTSPSKPLTEFEKIKESARSIASQEAAEGSWSWLNVYVGCLETHIQHLLKGRDEVNRKLDLIIEKMNN